MTNNSFELDTDKLADYLGHHINDFDGPLKASKFAGGQSNPTYLLESKTQKYVLRRQPPGKLLKGAHAVDREFRVMSALTNSDVPVAQALHLCTDIEVIGSSISWNTKTGEFYGTRHFRIVALRNVGKFTTP